MKIVAAVIPVLLVISALGRADSRYNTSNFSLASSNGPAVEGTASFVQVGSILAQSGRRTDAGRGYLQSMLTPMVKKASGTTLLIIGSALVAGGVVLLEATENGEAKVAGMILIGVGGVTIYKAIQVLISSGRDSYPTSGLGRIQIALRASF